MTVAVPSTLLDRANSNVALIVDDEPDILSLLHDALDEADCAVLLATGGKAALQRARQALPDIVLLDAMMPGLDGFGVARQFWATPQTAHIPIIFMTGLTEAEYLVAALDAGGVDFVTKPIKPREVMARMAGLVSAGGEVSGTAPDDGKLAWQKPLARDLRMRYWRTSAPPTPEPVLAWLRQQAAQLVWPNQPSRLDAALGPRRLTLRLHRPSAESQGRDWRIVMRKTSVDAVLLAMANSFRLAAREAEVLSWVVKGKVSRDIGDILDTSPATVKKHLERIDVKLGAETRTAAAGLAMTRVQQLHPVTGAARP